jgi:hypothetical protein
MIDLRQRNTISARATLFVSAQTYRACAQPIASRILRLLAAHRKCTRVALSVKAPDTARKESLHERHRVFGTGDDDRGCAAAAEIIRSAS